MYTCKCVDIRIIIYDLWIAGFFFGPASTCVYNRSFFLASHERLPIQMDLSTEATEVSSVQSKVARAAQYEIERVWLTCSTSYMAASIGT